MPHGRDHPRGCGAHGNRKRHEIRRRGSSPRVRGSRPYKIQERPEFGIIPAGAGLTRLVSAIARNMRDHPRGCGAHIPKQVYRTIWTGSSPRVRGSQNRDAQGCRSRGIIPAGAGLTLKNPNICAILYLPKAQNYSLLNILTGYSL